MKKKRTSSIWIKWGWSKRQCGVEEFWAKEEATCTQSIASQGETSASAPVRPKPLGTTEFSSLRRRVLAYIRDFQACLLWSITLFIQNRLFFFLKELVSLNLETIENSRSKGLRKALTENALSTLPSRPARSPHTDDVLSSTHMQQKFPWGMLKLQSDIQRTELLLCSGRKEGRWKRIWATLVTVIWKWEQPSVNWKRKYVEEFCPGW